MCSCDWTGAREQGLCAYLARFKSSYAGTGISGNTALRHTLEGIAKLLGQLIREKA